jgi:hypothetical protein
VRFPAFGIFRKAQLWRKKRILDLKVGKFNPVNV